MRFLRRFPIRGAERRLRYDLAYLLTCLVAAMLCGRNSTLAVAEWCRDEQELLKRLFGPRKSSCPDDSLSRKRLPGLDASQVEGAWADWIRMTLSAPTDEPIALSWENGAWGRHPGAESPSPALVLDSSQEGKPCCKCGSGRKPMKSFSHSPFSQPSPMLGASLRLTRGRPMCPFFKLSKP
jgi:hypothetical protein